MKIIRWLAMIPALFPAGCHYYVTGPALWHHNSSAAFDAWVSIWLIALAIPFWVFVVIRIVNKSN